MRKQAELAGPSCMTNALDDEMVFVLLGRDAAAPLAIRAWAEARITLGLNDRTDAKIVEAFACAETMEREVNAMQHRAYLAKTKKRTTCDQNTKGLIVRPCQLPHGHAGECGLPGGADEL